MLTLILVSVWTERETPLLFFFFFFCKLCVALSDVACFLLKYIHECPKSTTWCGVFFLTVRIFGEGSLIPHLCFFLLLLLEISSHTLIPLFMPGLVHSGSASWDNCGSVPLWVECELVSLIGFHTLPGQHSQPTVTWLGQGCMHV